MLDRILNSEKSDLKTTSLTAVVILAAGKGTRMGRADLPKVCFEIDGRPAINRIIETFKVEGFRRFYVVVGALAEKVMAAVGRDHPEVSYIYQDQQLGTGHAARKAAEALETLGHSGPILVTMGDKHIEGAAIRILLEGFIRLQADLALLAIPRTRAGEAGTRGAHRGTRGAGRVAGGGRILLDSSGQALAIVETADLARLAIADELRRLLRKRRRVAPEDVLEIAARRCPDPAKRARAVPHLLSLPREGPEPLKRRLEEILRSRPYNFVLAGKPRTAREIESLSKSFNPSLYLFRPAAFYRAVGMIASDNAQGEYYLTDAVRHLAEVPEEPGGHRYRIRAIPAGDPDLIQGFNSPDELLAIQDYVRRRKDEARGRAGGPGAPELPRSRFASVREWIRKVEAYGPRMRRWLARIYGPHDDLHQEKRRKLLAVLRTYGDRFGFEDRVVIVRAPGRVNLMGRHVDHRGAHNNFLAIHRETFAVAGIRDDDAVVAVNTDPTRFPDVRFGIGELIGRFAWSDWMDFVSSDWVRNLLRNAAGDWGNYIKAAMLRLQHKYHDLKIRGAKIALSGDVPIAAGLSSSSTIVVACLQAAIALNGLDLTAQQFIDLCGEGEWFVGSRGGAGDHAAIYLGLRGKIAHVGYLPFQVEKVVDAPKDWRVLIAESHIAAPKSSEARSLFNSKIASYNLGLVLLRQRCPEHGAALEHVRDIDPEKLGCSTSEIYRMLLKIPRFMTRKELRAMLSSQEGELLDANFATHDEPPRYPIRGVLLFGASESMRSRIAIDLLEGGRIGEFGELMRRSHDGDRVAIPGEGGKYGPFPDSSSDERLHELIFGLSSEDPGKVLRSQLYLQPGSYGCSTPEIDRMVDLASAVDGVAGAQIAGAGLGGCIMILAREDAVGSVRKALAEGYYRSRRLAPAVFECVTVEGAGLAEF